MRPKNTHATYGTNDYKSGPKREWFLFCKAGPSEVVNGVTMDADKETYIATLTDINGEESEQALVTPDRVDEYLVCYLTVRPQLKKGKPKSSDASETRENTHTGLGTIQNHRKALADLWQWQKAHFPEAMAGVLSPQTSANWKSIVGNFEKDTSNK